MAKIFMFLLISVAWVQSQEHDEVSPPKEVIERLIRIGDECVAESGAVSDSFYRFYQGNYSNDLNTKKYMSCYLEKANYVGSDGYFVKENVLAILGPYEKAEQFGKLLDQCNRDVKKVDPQDKYEKAFALVECLHANTPIKMKMN